MTDQARPTTRGPHALRQPGKAIVLMTCAGALVAVTTLIAKLLGTDAMGEPLHPLQVSAGRFVFGFISVALFATWARPAIRGAAWSVHLSRSLSGWLGVTCMFAASARMPLADATALTFLSPLVVMVLAVIFLGERTGPRRWMAAGLALAGAMVLVQPGSDAFRPAAFIALAAAALMGLEVTILKRLSDTEPALRILLINNGIGATFSLFASMYAWQWPEPKQLILLVLLGSTMVCAQGLYIQAMRRADASLVTPAIYSTLIFAAIYDFAAFGTIPDTIAVVGALMIVAGIVLLAILRESAKHR